MYDTEIKILEKVQTRDKYNELVNEYNHIAVCYAQKTESGGRENLFASRIIHENEIVYTIRYRDDIKAGQFLNDNNNIMKIISTHCEGRRKIIHIKTIKNDAEC